MTPMRAGYISRDEDRDNRARKSSPKMVTKQQSDGRTSVQSFVPFPGLGYGTFGTSVGGGRGSVIQPRVQELGGDLSLRLW